MNKFFLFGFSVNFLLQMSHSGPKSPSDDDESSFFLRCAVVVGLTVGACSDDADFAAGVLVDAFFDDDFACVILTFVAFFGVSVCFFFILASCSSMAVFRFSCFSFNNATFSGEVRILVLDHDWIFAYGAFCTGPISSSKAT